MRDSQASSTQALLEGARRSREACSHPTPEMLPARLWRLHKWKLAGLLLFLLFDLLMMTGFFRMRF